MTDEQDAVRAALTDARAALAEARAALVGVPKEALGELRTGRRILGIPRADKITPAGEAWHLGVLLVTDDAVLATGEIVRARAEVIRGFPAESQRARAAVAAAASRGGFAEGRIVHIGWRAIDLDALAASVLTAEPMNDAGPIALRGGEAVVRWSASGGYVPLRRYLSERVELLQHPPDRA